MLVFIQHFKSDTNVILYLKSRENGMSVIASNVLKSGLF
jgi:hypothetical protein